MNLNDSLTDSINILDYVIVYYIHHQILCDFNIVIIFMHFVVNIEMMLSLLEHYWPQLTIMLTFTERHSLPRMETQNTAKSSVSVPATGEFLSLRRIRHMTTGPLYPPGF